MTFHMSAGWYEPLADHDCPDAPGECTCAERDEDGRDQAAIARDDAEQGR